MLMHDTSADDAFACIIKCTDIYLNLNADFQNAANQNLQSHYNLTAYFNKPLSTFNMVFKPLSLSESLSGLLSGLSNYNYVEGQNYYIAFAFNNNTVISSDIYLIPVSSFTGLTIEDEFEYFNNITNNDISSVTLTGSNTDTKLETIVDSPLIDLRIFWHNFT